MRKETQNKPTDLHGYTIVTDAPTGLPLVADRLENTPVLALRLDCNGTVVNANRQARQWLGETIVGTAFVDCLVDFQAPEAHRLLGTEPRVLTVKTTTRMPESLVFDVHALPDGGVLALAGVDWHEQQKLRTEMLAINRELNDLTRQLHQANAELRRLNDLKNHFLGMAAHDLRRPLGAVMTYADFLREEVGAQLDPDHQGFLRTILKAAAGMKRLIDQFLNVAVIEAGKLRIERREVELATLFESVLPIIRLLADRKSISLCISAVPGLRVALDADKIGQALTNLLCNAIEHSKPDQAVWLEAECDAQVCRITVRDEGAGIAPEMRTRLFEPFAADGGHKTAGERSTGLGLAIAKLVVEAHGGSILVESAPDKGSTFTLLLPMDATDKGTVS